MVQPLEIDLGADAGDWYAGLLGVLELHKPDPDSPTADAGHCAECSHAYPCATVRAIAEAVYFELEDDR